MANPKFHHAGFVVRSIQECQGELAELTGSIAVSETVHDPLQQVNVAFLSYDAPGASQVELVEPAGEDCPVQALALRGGGLHHLCYEVDDLEKQLEVAKKKYAVIVRPPQPAVAFQGRRIAWVMTKHRLLIEYLERTSQKRR